ncbi:MAG TPA: carboxypeptidase-like regulatory domain-containing protein, partial [Pyrinomonadaceae bacterium]
TVGRALKTYRVSGRFVTADTNQPVAGVTVAYGTVDTRGRRSGGYGGGTVTNARGEFTTEGLAPGRYFVQVGNAFGPQPAQPEFYSDPLPFEVTDSDVAGLLVKLKRGATLSGVVTIEGVSDRAAAARMVSAVRVYSFFEADGRQMGAAGPSRPVNVNPDGTFLLTGLSPGRLRLGTVNDAVKGLSTARIELNGAAVSRGIDVAEGDQVAGVRIVMTYGTGAIVGQTNYVNGAPPPNSRVMALARPAGATPASPVARSAEVDARGFFRIEGLPPGEYEVTVNVLNFGPARGLPGRGEPQRVALGEGGEAKVTAVVNFQPEQRKEP